MYKTVIAGARTSDIRFAVGGGLSAMTYAGQWRNTKDIDLYVLPRDRERMIALVTDLGLGDYYEKQGYDRNWIYRSYTDETIVDVMWAMANQRSQVTESWLDGPEIEVDGECSGCSHRTSRYGQSCTFCNTTELTGRTRLICCMAWVRNWTGHAFSKSSGKTARCSRGWFRFTVGSVRKPPLSCRTGSGPNLPSSGRVVNQATVAKIGRRCSIRGHGFRVLYFQGLSLRSLD